MDDLIKIVSLQDLHETAPPPDVKTYPLVVLISSTSEIQLESLYPSSTTGYWYNESLCENISTSEHTDVFPWFSPPLIAQVAKRALIL